MATMDSLPTTYCSSHSRRVCASTTNHNTVLHQVMAPEDCSSLNRLISVTAYIHHFIDNLRLSEGARRVTPLTSTELNTAKQRWIKHYQEQAFSGEISALKTTRQTRQTNKSTCLVRQLRLFLASANNAICAHLVILIVMI